MFLLKMQIEGITFWGYLSLSILRSLCGIVDTASVHKKNLTLLYLAPWTGKIGKHFFQLLSNIIL